MLLEQIIFKGRFVPQSPVTRSHRIMKPADMQVINKAIKKPVKPLGNVMSELEKKVYKALTFEYQTSFAIADKCKIKVGHFYQVVRKLNERDLLETKRVSGEGNIRYRHYKRRV